MVNKFSGQERRHTHLNCHWRDLPPEWHQEAQAPSVFVMLDVATRAGEQGVESQGDATSGPHLHGHHGLLGTDGRQEVLLAEELQRELDQEATDLLELLLGAGWVLALETRLGQVAIQLHYVTHVAGRQAAEHLEEEEPNT